MKVIVTVTNDLVTDQRVARTCDVLSSMNADILLVGRKLKNSLPIKRDYPTRRLKLLFNKEFAFYAEYNIRLFFFLLFHKFDVLFANDLDVLMPNVMVAKLKHKPIVYDSHEYFTGMPELVGRDSVKKFWKRIEDRYIPKVDTMITVNQSIANMYHKEYGIDVQVIRNVPLSYESNPDIQCEEVIKEIGSKYIIYQGAVNLQRGLEETIAAMEFVEEYKFVIAGDGDILNALKTMVASLPWRNKIVFLGRISPANLRKYTMCASLGLSPELDCCKNYHFALPNKFFDYINANIPVLVSNLVEMVNIVNQYNIGEIIKSHDAKELGSQINSMLANKERLAAYKENTKIAAGQLCWEKESLKLKEILSEYVSCNTSNLSEELPENSRIMSNQNN
ncbi:MAG: glycosyltransferase [Bacteroidales bacterium]|nr:glycosyltransferase [Bacteroidales bacterium]